MEKHGLLTPVEREILTPLQKVVWMLYRVINALLLGMPELVRGNRRDPFLLRTYGMEAETPLWGTAVEKALAGFTAFLVFVCLVEAWAWVSVWSYAVRPAWAVAIGLSFAGVMVLIERSIITFDLSRGNAWATSSVRFTVLALAVFLTSIPVELSWFQKEIDENLATQRDERIRDVRKDAVSRVERLSERADVKQHVDARRQARESMEAAHERELRDLRLVSVRLSDEAAKEASGMGGTGKRGAGEVARFKKELADGAANRISEASARHSRELAAFDQQTQAQMTVITARRDAKAEEIRNLAEGALAGQYGGVFQVADGFLARFRALQNMRETDPMVDMTVWLCRILMAVLGFAGIFLKLTSGAEVKAYFSLDAQARSGNPFAKMVVASEKRTADFHAAWHVLAREVAAEYLRLRAQFVGWCLPDGESGYRSQTEIRKLLLDAWGDTMASLFRRLETMEASFLAMGLPIPTLAHDPRADHFFEFTEDDLREFGWQSPEAYENHAQREKRKGLAALVALWQECAGKLHLVSLAWESERRGLMVSNSEFATESNPMGFRPIFEVRQRLLKAWEEGVAPVIVELTKLESQLAAEGGEIPAWPYALNDPRTIFAPWDIRVTEDYQGVANEYRPTMTARDFLARPFNVVNGGKR